MRRLPCHRWNPPERMTRPGRAFVLAGMVAVVGACDAGREAAGPAAPAGGSGGQSPALVAIPVDATPNVTAFYGAYVDQAGDGSRLDYMCGPKTYEGHRGTDLLLKNFAAQDSGVRVLAAAGGRVVGLADGFADRNVTAGLGGFGNHVMVEHAPTLVSVYAHLRRHSITVAVGDPVSPGQMLGLVGSSGNSNWPHLHFEVRDGGSPVDPYAGPCNGDPSRWQEQPAYQDSVLVLDADATLDDVSSLRALLERPAPAGTLRGDEPTVSVWVQLLNAPRCTVRFDVTDPTGRLHARVEQPFGGTFSIWYSVVTLPVAGSLITAGRWSVQFYLAERLAWAGALDVVGGGTARAPIRADNAPRPALRIWNPLARDGRSAEPIHPGRPAQVSGRSFLPLH